MSDEIKAESDEIPPDIEFKFQVMVIGHSGTWGIGFNKEEAMVNAMKPKKYSVFIVPEGSKVNDFGGIWRPLGTFPSRLIETYPKEKKEKNG